ncbi:hypothetical protein IPM62_00905 [Candidatus Woesebacteria bacterium]|nr:MAG: hypothetical protein IPM62_00905 [Candidatus Woesebacteria bacterium]
MKKNGLDTTALLVVVVMFILLGTGTYLFIKSKITIPESQKIVSLDKKTWKNYNDDKLGISFKYPGEWHTTQLPQAARIEIALNDGEEGSGKIAKFEITRGVYGNQGDNEKLTFDQFIELRGLSKLTQEEIDRANFVTDKYNIGKYQGIRYTYKPTSLAYFVTEIHLAQSPTSTDIITITYRHNEKESVSEKSIPVTLSQILSTFNFTKQ